MIDAVFSVSPPGIFGMNTLANVLNAMKGSGEISDWHPRRAITDSHGVRYIVQFADDCDAARATTRWTTRQAAS